MTRRGWARAAVGPLVVIAAVLMANITYLTGVFNANPLVRYSHLAQVTTGLLPGDNSIDPNNGLGTQALGRAAVRASLHGESVWWNYNEQVGAPLAGDMQSAALFYPFVLLLGLSNGLLLFHIALQLIAGLATYCLLRRLGGGGAAGVMGGILFALNGTFSWLGNAVVNPIPFLPLMLLGVESLFADAERAHAERATTEGAQSPGAKPRWRRRPWWVLIAISLAWSLYAGFPEVAYLDGLLVAVWAGVRTVQLRGKGWLPFAALIALGAVVGLLLAAPIVVAFEDYLPHAYLGIHVGVPPTAALSTGSFPRLFMPYLDGPIFGFNPFDASGALGVWWGNVGGYLSPAVLVLAVFGFLADRRNRLLALALGGWTLVAVGRVYATPPFIGRLLNLIPGMSAVAVYRYIPASFEFALVVLAALGFHRLVGHQDRLPAIKVRWLAVAVGGVTLLLAALLPLALRQQRLLDLRLLVSPGCDLSDAQSLLVVSSLPCAA
ncbi:MAG: hypothetical protein NVSMB32_02820 [Actinomycetota bacterium]